MEKNPPYGAPWSREPAVRRAVVELAGHEVLHALKAHVRALHAEVARVVVVLRHRLVRDRGERTALHHERPRVDRMRREGRDRLEVPHDRRARVDRAVASREEHLPLRHAVVLVPPVADVAAHLVVDRDEQAVGRQRHVELRLPARERLHALHRKRTRVGHDAEDGRAVVLQVPVVDHELRRAEVDVRLDDGHGGTAADVVRLAVAGLDRQAFLVRRRVGGHDRGLVVGLTVAHRAEFLVRDHAGDALLRVRHHANHTSGEHRAQQQCLLHIFHLLLQRLEKFCERFPVLRREHVAAGHERNDGVQVLHLALREVRLAQAETAQRGHLPSA